MLLYLRARANEYQSQFNLPTPTLREDEHSRSFNNISGSLGGEITVSGNLSRDFERVSGEFWDKNINLDLPWVFPWDPTLAHLP